MATKRRRGKVWEFVVKRKALLPRPLYLRFEAEDEGDRYVAKLEALLDRGIVPEEFLVRDNDVVTVEDAARKYLTSQYVPDSDQKCLAIMVAKIGTTRIRAVDYAWTEACVSSLKREQQLAPTTIRHYVGALARCFDWGSRHGIAALATNPLRLLPRGYATYSDLDRPLGATNFSPRIQDIERDRRLSADEERRVRAVLDGAVPTAKQRGLTLSWQGALECLFTLALESAMRMREMYTLTNEQIDLRQKTIFLDKTKNGDKRQVPLSTPAIATIRTYRLHLQRGTRGMAGFTGAERIFPWWNGRTDPRTLRVTTSRLSHQFARIFEAAECPDVRFHDLRHEATSRLFERTRLSDIEVSRITGHKDPRVLRRYSNLRGSDLARKLW